MITKLLQKAGLLLALTSSVMAETPATEQEVHLAFKGLADAAEQLDHDQYFSFFDKEKFTALNHDGTVTHNFEDFQEAFLRQIAFIKSYSSLDFKNVKTVAIDAQTAVLVNEYNATLVLKNDDQVSASGAGTQVWSKSSGTWKLVNVSSSVKPTN